MVAADQVLVDDELELLVTARSDSDHLNLSCEYYHCLDTKVEQFVPHKKVSEYDIQQEDLTKYDYIDDYWPRSPGSKQKVSLELKGKDVPCVYKQYKP